MTVNVLHRTEFEAVEEFVEKAASSPTVARIVRRKAPRRGHLARNAAVLALLIFGVLTLTFSLYRKLMHRDPLDEGCSAFPIEPRFGTDQTRRANEEAEAMQQAAAAGDSVGAVVPPSAYTARGN